jgi:two-component system, NtrC family, sensor histidine kinase KinB
MRSELVAVASHELQTPLTTLRMTLLMLREGSDALPERQREIVATGLVGVEQLGEIIHEFLDLTRIEAGELRLDLEPVQISDLVTDAIERWTNRVEGQRVQVSTSVPPHGTVVLGDARRLRSVLDNLLSNALKYSTADATVVVDVSTAEASNGSESGSVVIAVTDSGPGVPTAYRTRVFEKFFRLEHHLSHGRSAARGAGIGLYMCRQIVELHGGHIGCGPGPDGHGARFVVELPRAVAAETAKDTDALVARH